MYFSHLNLHSRLYQTMLLTIPTLTWRKYCLQDILQVTSSVATCCSTCMLLNRQIKSLAHAPIWIKRSFRKDKEALAHVACSTGGVFKNWFDWHLSGCRIQAQFILPSNTIFLNLGWNSAHDELSRLSTYSLQHGKLKRHTLATGIEERDCKSF